MRFRCRHPRLLLWVPFLLCWAAAGLSRAATLYVSPTGSDQNPGTASKPLETPQRATALVRKLDPKQPREVLFQDGTYVLWTPWVLGREDSGTPEQPIRYRAADGARPLFSAALELKPEWTQTQLNGRLVWVGDYRKQLLSEPFSAAWRQRHRTGRIRQLFVDGERRPRARHPNVGRWSYLRRWSVAERELVGAINALSPEQLRQVQKESRVELHVQKHWKRSILRLQHVVADGPDLRYRPWESDRVIEFSDKGQWKDPQQCYYLENSLGFLDAPGEWFLDDGRIYYVPLPGENVRELQFRLPTGLETLLQVQGERNSADERRLIYSDARFVSNLEFRGLRFAHTTWENPRDEAYVTWQGDYHLDQDGQKHNLSSAVWMREARGIRFLNNVISEVGNNGLTLARAGHDISFIGNIIRNVSGNGISIGLDTYKSTGFVNGYSFHAGRCGQPANSVLRRNKSASPVRVQQNAIEAVGQDFSGCVGVFTPYSNHLELRHNQILDVPYSGISLGWGWSNTQIIPRTNDVSFNYISRAMRLHDDGGGIYHLGNSDGTRIHHNRIEDIRTNPATSKNGHHSVAGIYFDSGVKGIMAYANTIQHLGKAAKAIHLQTHVPPVARLESPDATALAAMGIDRWVARKAAGLGEGYGLVARWSFDQVSGRRVPDQGRFQLDGVSYPMSSQIPLRAGEQGKAAEFDGSRRIRVADDPVLRGNRFSIVARIRLDRDFASMAADYPTLIEKQDWARQCGFFLGADPAGRLLFRVLGRNTQAETRSLVPGASGWVQVVAVFDGQEARLYWNGELLGEAGTAPSYFTRAHSQRPIWIGNGFEGAIDDLAFYQVELQPDVIARLDSGARPAARVPR